MRTSFSVAAVAAVFLLGSAFTANAANYDGPGFTGTLWLNGESGKVEQMGTVHVGSPGFLMNMVSGGQKVSSLIKWDSETVWSLMHDQKMYMEIPPEQSGWEPYENSPCMGYENGEKLGSETVNGRATEKWRCTGEKNVSQGEAAADTTVWYDPELEFLVKSVDDNGEVFEVRDVMVGAQDASMFEIPAGYTKLDMNAMMQQGQQ